MKTRNILLTVGLTLLSLTAMAQKSFDVKLWNNKMPNSNGDDKDVPELKVFLPAEGKATGRAVVLCPGGAYRRLCTWASWGRRQADIWLPPWQQRVRARRSPTSKFSSTPSSP